MGDVEVLRELLDKAHAVPAEGPDLLYHYTSPAGFLGILTSGTLWLSHSGFSKDRSENSYPRKVLDAATTKFQCSGPRTRGTIVASVHELGKWQLDCWTASFCENGDLLSQWRAYSSQGGYSIGFKCPDILKRISQLGYSGWNLSPVEYEYKEQVATVVRIFETAEQQIKDLPLAFDGQLSPETVCNEILLAARRSIGVHLILFKAPAFREEREWRVVAPIALTNPQFVDFFERSGTLVPYLGFRMSDDRLPIAEVRISPIGDPELSEKSAINVLGFRGYSRVVVRHPDVRLI